MNENTLDPISFLGKMGVYRENDQCLLVQVTGIRQPDVAYLFLELMALGTTLAQYQEAQWVFIEGHEDLIHFEAFELGGEVDSLRIAPNFIDVPYMGMIDFSEVCVERFGRQDALFWR